MTVQVPIGRLTRSQTRADAAWRRVAAVRNASPPSEAKDYKRVARRFPALLHNCGLCQAVSFAVSKSGTQRAYEKYLDDLAGVMGCKGGAALEAESGRAPLSLYLKLSRAALEAAGWLSRYAEALLPDPPSGAEGGVGT